MNFSQDQIVTLLAAFIGSGTIAAIISAIISLHNNSKNARLEYITKERGQWRCEIRQIAVELENAKVLSKDNRNGKRIREVLSKIKVRINPNGRLDEGTEKQDKYIWNRIRVIENMCGRVTEDVQDWDILEEELEKLIQDLSILLKDDWERTKIEVSLWYRVKNMVKGLKKRVHTVLVEKEKSH